MTTVLWVVGGGFVGFVGALFLVNVILPSGPQPIVIGWLYIVLNAYIGYAIAKRRKNKRGS
jgi:hypothetical protein